MAQRTKAVLKSYFEAGDKPTEAQFGDLIDSMLNQGYSYMGVAILSTDPGTPDCNVFYIASTPGTYANFGSPALQVAEGEVAILKYDTAWHKEVTGAATSAQVTELGQNIPILVMVDTSAKYRKDDRIYLLRIYVRRASQATWESIYLNADYSPLSGAFSYVLTASNTVLAKATADIVASDIVLLRYDSDHKVIGGELYANYLAKNPSVSHRMVFGASATTTYNDDGTIYFGNIFTQDLLTGLVTLVAINDTKTSTITNFTAFWVLQNDNTIATKLMANVAKDDIVLLTVSSSGVVTGGALYADYIAKKRIQLAGFFAGKKLVANGDSVMYGTTVADRSKVFPMLAASALGMTAINYAIGGTTIARKSSDYDGVFLVYQDWLDAIDAGTLDTTKKYLVKDNINVPTRPYHIYYNDNGVWVAGGNLSTDTGRTPLVDRIEEMDTDADVVVLCCGSNDWAYEWTPFGTDASRDKTTFYGALHEVCQYLMDTYEDKLILFITPPFAWRYQPEGVSNATWDMTTWNAESPNLEKTWWDYVDAMRIVLKQYGIPLYDMGAELSFSQQNTWWCGDADGKFVHPGSQAQQAIAESLCAKLNAMKYAL